MDSDLQTRQLHPKVYPLPTISEAPLVSAGLQRERRIRLAFSNPLSDRDGPSPLTPEENSHTQHRAYSVVWGGRLKSPEDDTGNVYFTVNT